MIKRTLILALIVSLLGGCTWSQLPPTSQPISTTLLETQEIPTPEPAITVTTMPTLVTENTSLPSNTLQPQALATDVTPTHTNKTKIPISGQSKGIIVDHTSVELFEVIPEEFLAKARNIKMVFADRSVGQNINVALDCLTAASWADTPGYCRRDYINNNWEWESFNQADFNGGRVPKRILLTPNPVKYDRKNWIFEAHGGDWSSVTQDFIERIAPAYIDEFDVLSYQFNYFHVDDKSDIADPENGFFSNNPRKFDINDLEAYISAHPDTIFFFWTTSLARGIGSKTAVDFNQQMRDYAVANNKILFDVADILSHTDQGVPCYDNRDGIEYCSMRGNCENYPDDGLQLLAICQDYTTETNGGHLGSVSAGGIRIAKAFWVLMAKIAGWDDKP